MLDYAYRLLKLQYEQALKIVNSSKEYTLFAKEKWRHSLQVAGAGNFLIKHIGWLQDKPKDYIAMVKSAVLLHDVCRFTQMAKMYKCGKTNYDHGIGGAILLKNMPAFDDIRVWLPIKHHGHLIERLYDDEDYKNIADEQLRAEVEKICFIIRDADKIANLYMASHESEMLPLFMGRFDEKSAENRKFSTAIVKDMNKPITLPRENFVTGADYLAGLISWIFDINYQYAVDYCRKLKVVEKMWHLLDNYCDDTVAKKQYQTYVEKYLKEHEFLR